MKIFRDISEINDIENTVVTVGTFDGLHRGHQDILNVVISEAKKSSLKSCVVTFNPHPRMVVSNNFEKAILTPLEEKAELLEQAGIDYLFVVEFTKEFSSMNYDEFMKTYLFDKLKAKKIVIGYDHKFGKDRSGDKNKLNELSNALGIDVITVNAVKSDQEEISSTKIRNAVRLGEIEKANAYLNRNYVIEGIIVKGARRGRELGFPTANISININKLIPKSGVYFTKCFIGNKEYYGVTNIGLRPTFHDVSEVIVETHIINFNQDIYGKKLKVEFLERIRDEKKYESIDSLVEQIAQDKQDCIKRIKN